MAEHAGGSTSVPPKNPRWRSLLKVLLSNLFWCLAPILIVLAAMVVVSLLAGKAEVPFIYR